MEAPFTIPKSIQKKIVGNNYFTHAVGYIYPDGIVVKHTETFKARGHEFEKEFVDIFPCRLPVFLNDGYARGAEFVGRIVVHNADWLCLGLRQVEHYTNGGSENTKNKGITVNGWSLTLANGARVHISDLVGLLSCDFCMQNTGPCSCMDWNKHRDYAVTIHGEEPLKKAA